MPALRNPRHEKFVREYLRLGVARRAYVAAGYKAQIAPRRLMPSAADVCASRLLRRDKTQARLRELTAMAAKRHEVTEDTLIEELEQARTMALANAQSGAAVQATMGKARITGHIIDRKEVGEPGQFERMSEQELRTWIAENVSAQALQTVSDTSTSIGTSDCQLENVGRQASHAPAASKTDAAPLPEPTHDGTGTKQ